MGIPSYFSFIIKNYKNIIKKREQIPQIDHLCMDCNSIIYDSFYDIEAQYNKTAFDLSTIEMKIIESVIERIENLITEISPEKTVFITFDGVAPFAKMNQQRKRRYKSSFMTKIPELAQTIPSDSDKKIWNTTYITPGTQFMELLSKTIYQHFTQFRIEDAQSATPSPLITAPKGGVLNEKRCTSFLGKTLIRSSMSSTI